LFKKDTQRVKIKNATRTTEVQGKHVCYLIYYKDLICMVKLVKFILQQAVKVQRGSRGIALLFP
jgi:hypothetical protein